MEAVKIRVAEIEVDPDQPREIYSNMEPLVESIRANGFQPQMAITVRNLPDAETGKKYRTVIGNRRTLACEKSGVTEVWAFIDDDMSEKERYKLQLMENEHRENLTPMNRARAIQKGLDRGISMNRLGKVFAVSLATLKADLELIDLAPALHQFVDNGSLPKEVARKLATSGKVNPGDDGEKVFVPWSPGEQVSVFNNFVKGEEKADKMIAAIQAYIDKQNQQNLFAAAKKQAGESGGLSQARKAIEKLEKAASAYDKKWTGDLNVINSKKRDLEKLKMSMRTLKRIADRTMSQINEFEAMAKINAPKEAVAV